MSGTGFCYHVRQCVPQTCWGGGGSSFCTPRVSITGAVDAGLREACSVPGSIVLGFWQALSRYVCVEWQGALGPLAGRF
jgi:hypothetical protein